MIARLVNYDSKQMRRQRHSLWKISALVAAIAVAAACSSPTRPPACFTKTVFESQSYYVDRAESERTFSGPLEFRNTPATPNGRDHRFFLNGMAVYSGGFTTQPIFEAAIGTRVEIRGKVVDVGFGPEIWAAAVTTCR